MEKFTEIKNYIGRSLQECKDLPAEALDRAIRVDFDNDSVVVDETIDIRRGHLYLESNHQGIVKGVNERYTLSYLNCASGLGKLRRIVFLDKKVL